MERFKQDIGPQGLQIPKEIAERCGIKEGVSAIIEIHRQWIKIFPEEAREGEIINSALIYLLENVGDAVGVGKPISKDGKWVVPVTLPYAMKQVGELVFSKSGNLILPESSPIEQILKRINED